jgi:catechol 2,3-dioxygenase-like lactoylglutathione lyase family enzyme
MEQRISLVTFGVKDLARATAFYEALGWRRGMPGEDWVSFFQAGGMIFGLWSAEQLAEDAGLSAAEGAAAPGARFALAHNVPSRDAVDATLAEAVAAGATVTRPAADTFWGGYTGYFRDPEGFLWEIAWNPHFPLAEDGSISLPG